ncbi:MAG: hypothetical protein HY364_05385 [Candidatus Aenigmarchaeota archaeon]|nr:hypothetical protein [Candidatus Aenigmarchaeota archaeon]
MSNPKNSIYVPAKDGEFYLGEKLLDLKGSPISNLDKALFLPTIKDLVTAYFGRNEQGWLSPAYRQAVHRDNGQGEWTSTYTDGKIMIERPLRVYFDEKSEMWIAEGDNKIPVELPPDGWITEIDYVTGLPSRTSINKDDAVRTFGEDASYFSHPTPDGFSPIVRDSLGRHGPFEIVASLEPGTGLPDKILYRHVLYV